MKKRNVIALALVGIFAASTAFAASQFIMGTGGTSGTYYPLGGAISQIITDHSGGKVACVAQATGASVENLNLLNAGDIDLALVQNDTADYAKKGEMFFKGGTTYNFFHCVDDGVAIELDGEWLTAGPYTVVHRAAIDLDYRGQHLAHLFFEQAEQMSRDRGWPSVRVDTNHDNREMLALIAQRGYQLTGKCYYYHGGRHVERLAFEKPL